MEWIKTSERLPQDDEVVLIFVEGDFFKVQTRLYEWDSRVVFILTPNYDCDFAAPEWYQSQVEYWMPIVLPTV